MTLIAIFTVSGLAILTLLSAKSLERKRRRPFFILSAISKGDIRVRELYHKMVHMYSDGKEKTLFFIQKQIPIRSKNFLNKFITFIKEKREYYVGNMRDARLLKKPEGISEFFKNMSDIEKGNGEINDVYVDGSQDEKKELK